ncbi:MAG: hypothetical protein KGD63_14495 [Candidatus Lokiarchaeota archaeon]|nr:hypothetical protein [Candidatus Lokiarchaeota archaeon]
MVAIMGEDLFKRSKEFFKSKDIKNTLETYEKFLHNLDHTKDHKEYIDFLKNILTFCEKKGLRDEEALILRDMGRTYSIFKKYPDSLKHHRLSLKIQRQLGKKREVADGLLFIAEDLVVSGAFEECFKSYEEAMDIYQKLGNIENVRKIENKLKSLKEYSKEAVEEDYIMNKFHVDEY